jgi:hypothetical protein
MAAKPQRQYVLFHNGGLGDFLMFVFLAEQLHAGGKAAHVTIVVPRTATFLSGFVRSYPYLAVVEASLRSPVGFARLLSCALRQTTAVIHPTLGSIPPFVKLFAWLLTRMPGSSLVGFRDMGGLTNLLYTKTLHYDTTKNYADTIRELAEVAGGRPDLNPPRLTFASAPGYLERYGLPKGGYVFFHPGAGMSARKRSFATDDAVEIIRHLLAHHPGLRVVLSGGPDEKKWVEELAAMVGDVRVVPLVAAPAEVLATLIQNARLYIGGDTGVTHLACFVGAKVLEVAHNATANWLCFYCPGASVLYRLAQEESVRSDPTYLAAHAKGALRPFAVIPATAVREEITRSLG